MGLRYSVGGYCGLALDPRRARAAVQRLVSDMDVRCELPPALCMQVPRTARTIVDRPGATGFLLVHARRLGQRVSHRAYGAWSSTRLVRLDRKVHSKCVYPICLVQLVPQHQDVAAIRAGARATSPSGGRDPRSQTERAALST